MSVQILIKHSLCLVLLCFQINSVLSRNQFSVGAVFESENDENDFAFRAAIDRVNALERKFELIPVIKYSAPDDTSSIEESVCSLLAEGVIAIFGPNAESSNIVSSICHSLEIPHILFGYKNEMSSDERVFYSMTVNVYPDELHLAKAYAAVVQSFSWRRYCLIYESQQDLIQLQDILQIHNPGDSPITVRELEFDDTQGFLPFLKNLKEHKELNLIINCALENIIPLLEQAKELNMAGEYQSIFFAPLDTHTIDFGELASVNANVTAIRIMDPTDFNVQNIVHDLEQRARSKGNYLKVSPDQVKTNLLLIYDAVWVFAKGLSELEISDSLEPPQSDCGNPSPWQHGKQIVEFIKARREEGSTGRIDLNQYGQRSFFTAQILELTPEGFTIFSTWDPVNGIQNIGSESSEKRKELKLHNKTFVVSSRIGKPFLFDLGEGNETLLGNARYEGYSMDLIDEISKIVGFKYVFKITKNYGAVDKATGKWNGIVREVMDERADMGICDLTMTSARRTVVDFTPPFMTLGISLLYAKAASPPPDLFSFRLPFSPDVWKYMSAAYVGISILVFITARMAPEDWENPHPCQSDPEELENVWTLRNSVWLAIGSIMGQGCDLLPKSPSTRILTGMWWFFALMMLNSYTANLAAFLTNSAIDTSIKSVEDLAKQSNIKYGAVAGGSTQGFFRESDDSLYAKMWSFMDAERPSVWTERNDLGVERVRKSKRLYAFFMESTTLEYEVERDCNLYQVGKWLDYKTYGIAMPFNSPWRKQISEAILKLGESGALVELKRRWWKEKYGGVDCAAAGGGGGDTPELGIENVGGVFLALGAGLFVAFLIGFVEYFYNIQNVALEEKISMKDAFILETMFALKFWITTKPVRGSGSKSSSSKQSHSASSSSSSATNSKRKSIKSKKDTTDSKKDTTESKKDITESKKEKDSEEKTKKSEISMKLFKSLINRKKNKNKDKEKEQDETSFVDDENRHNKNKENNDNLV